jgi:hypothetical protein
MSNLHPRQPVAEFLCKTISGALDSLGCKVTYLHDCPRPAERNRKQDFETDRLSGRSNLKKTLKPRKKRARLLLPQ